MADLLSHDEWDTSFEELSYSRPSAANDIQEKARLTLNKIIKENGSNYAY